MNRKELHAVLDNAAEGIVVLDRLGFVRFANPVAARLLGRAPDRLVGHDVRQLVGGLDRVLADAGSRIEREQVTIRRDGLGTPVHLSLSEGIEVGGEMLRSLFIRDGAEPGSADRKRGEFISVMNHELRTPLSAIIGSLKVIEGGAAGVMPPEMAPMVEMALRNAGRMLGLINDVLEAERIGSGNIEIAMQSTDLGELTSESVAENGALAAAKDLTLVMRASDGPLRVAGDPRRLVQVISNLVSNAVKFSDEHATIDIAAEATVTGARVTVSDTGPGIAADFQPRIFGKYARSDAEDGRNQTGTGLGLYISKALIEAHSGTIDFSSVPGRTRFWIELPLLPALDTTDRATPRPGGTGGGSAPHT